VLGTFLGNEDAGIVGCRLLVADGRQLEAGSVIWSDGSHARYGYLDDPNRPEYSYLRQVDYCSSTALAVRASLFHDLRGFSRQWQCSTFSAVDLAFRVRRADYAVYYQPNARVLVHAAVDDQMTYDDCLKGEASALVQQSFAAKWAKVLSGHGVPDGDVETAKDRLVVRRAFVADSILPAPDRDSGSLRMVNVLRLLREQGFKVTFASMGLEARQPYLSALQGLGVECLHRPYEHSIQQHLRRRGDVYDIVILSRFDTAAELLDYARKYCKRAKIVFDTVDLHFQRLASEAQMLGDVRLQRLADRKRSEELKLIARADTTLVVSEVDRAYLAHAAPTATVRVLSNIHEVKGCQAPFAERRDILFIGGFGHPPNKDAVIYFCENVLPLVHRELPDVRFLVIGADPPAEILRLASDRVKILGQVPDIDVYLNRCRLSVAPLRFGAGVKGKINQSLAFGLPVVATTLAIEGMFLEHGQSVLVADTARAFAEAVVTLYEDRELWLELSHNGLAVAERCFGPDTARQALASLISEW
jgi:glycosyltransferase involved in cell wall biosynthesis